MTSASLPVNPWEKWGWAFASIWLVFLISPVLAVVDADVGVATKTATLLCILGFA